MPDLGLSASSPRVILEWPFVNQLYYARVLETFAAGPNYGARVGVYVAIDGKETQIGEHHRNYQTFFQTFFPFRLGPRDLALYSPNCTTTRIMELSLCREIRGEEPSGLGFCPVDYYFPTYVELETLEGPSKGERNVRNEPNPSDLLATHYSQPVTPILYRPFGFVAGCNWGDDVFYKIQLLDLARADEGIIGRDDRFGYIELPKKVTLKDAINTEDYDWDMRGERFNIHIAVQHQYDLRTGKPPEE